MWNPVNSIKRLISKNTIPAHYAYESDPEDLWQPSLFETVIPETYADWVVFVSYKPVLDKQWGWIEVVSSGAILLDGEFAGLANQSDLEFVAELIYR